MSSEAKPRALNPEEELSRPDDSPTAQGRAEETGRGRTSARAKAANRAPPVNAIQPTRHLPRERREPLELAAGAEVGAAAPASLAGAQQASTAGPPPDKADRADDDPWTVPQSVRDRFVQDGHRFFFPDGAPAFKDLGRRLTTVSENTQVVHSLIEIAQARGWSEVTVSGTERFRQEAWRQARMVGLNVRGYRPTDPEQAALIRAFARNLSMPVSRRPDTIAAETAVPEPRAPSGAPVLGPPSAVAPDPRSAPKERIVGTLLDHGPDAYRHDPQEELSYFVSVQTREGKREIWGKDLERAMTKSLTQPQIGDEVVLQKTGRDVVTVKRQERDGEGQLKSKEVETHRNRWVIEKSALFAERATAAQVVRDPTIDARAAVRDRPALAGTYLNLKAGELAAQRLADPEDRRRFVALLRAALADTIERGEPLQPVRLRERAAPVPGRPPREAERGSAR